MSCPAPGQASVAVCGGTSMDLHFILYRGEGHLGWLEMRSRHLDVCYISPSMDLQNLRLL